MKERIIRDPIHRFISLSHYPFIQELVDTPYFQRLRRLSQLGVSSYVYPSATHNRLNHSLGAMEVFVKLYDHLHRDGMSDNAKELRKIGVAAILLHDIGHGAFSHASEIMFQFKHENITNDFIKNTEIKDILAKYSIDAEAVTKIVEKVSPPEHKLITQLISSQLDADRLDYLSRDTYFTGAELGRIDLERIIRTMEIYEGAGDFNGYAISNFKGIQSLESYILARHQMYQGVYFHKTTRCFELMIERLFSRLRILIQEGKMCPPEELAFLKDDRKITYSDILLLDDHILYCLISKFSRNEDVHLRDIANRIINRLPLKAIELQSKDFKRYTDNIDKIRKNLELNSFPPEYYLLSDEATETPYSPYSIKGPDDDTTVITNIFVVDNEGAPKEISSLSPVVKSLSEEKSNFRIYVPQECKSEALSIMGLKRR